MAACGDSPLEGFYLNVGSCAETDSLYGRRAATYYFNKEICRMDTAFDQTEEELIAATYGEPYGFLSDQYVVYHEGPSLPPIDTILHGEQRSISHRICLSNLVSQFRGFTAYFHQAADYSPYNPETTEPSLVLGLNTILIKSDQVYSDCECQKFVEDVCDVDYDTEHYCIFPLGEEIPSPSLP